MKQVANVLVLLRLRDHEDEDDRRSVSIPIYVIEPNSGLVAEMAYDHFMAAPEYERYRNNAIRISINGVLPYNGPELAINEPKPVPVIEPAVSSDNQSTDTVETIATTAPVKAPAPKKAPVRKTASTTKRVASKKPGARTRASVSAAQ